MVTPKNRSRRDRKKAAIRERIVATAMKLFSRHGLAQVTVDHIADVADIGKGTMYNYFKTKEDIVVAFMVEVEHQVQLRVKRFRTTRGRLDSILARFISLQFRLKRPHHHFVRVLLGQMFTRTEQLIPYLLEMQKAIDPPLEALFTDLQARGVVRRDVNREELIFIFKTIHLGLTALWAIEGPPFRNTEKAVKREMALFCEGLEGKR